MSQHPTQFKCPRCGFRHHDGCGFSHGVEVYDTQHFETVMERKRRCPRCEVKFKTCEKTGPVVVYLNEGLPLDQLPDCEPVIEPPEPVFYHNRLPGMVPANEVVVVE